jgi:hypothetical protein
MAIFPVEWNPVSGSRFQPGAPDMLLLQQRMQMRQAQLGASYMPISQPGPDEISALGSYYNMCLANIQQLRFGMPLSGTLTQQLLELMLIREHCHRAESDSACRKA